MNESTLTSGKQQTSAWSPLKIRAFRVLWIASIASNTGTWMHEVGAGWLMASLTGSPVMVALVQTAITLPIFLLAMFAGVLSDIVDRRQYILVILAWHLLVASLLGILTMAGITNAWILLALTFCMGIGMAMLLPAWASIVPELVPRHELRQAIALNSMSINAARAIGPAIAGLIISLAGTGVVFMLNALSFCAVLWVIYQWERQPSVTELPSERFFGALKAGLRYTRHSTHLHTAMIRAAAFFMFASAVWALLPLVAKYMNNGGPQALGFLMASMGAGAVGGAFTLPQLKDRLESDALVAGATLLYALSMIVLAEFNTLLPLCLAMAMSGLAWITILSSFHVAAQLGLPDWVRSRGLAAYMMIFMGCMAGGSLIWGKVAEHIGIPSTLIVAAGGMVLAGIFAMRWRLSGIENIDLSPSMHWPSPMVRQSIIEDQGPVLVTVEYEVSPENKARFIRRMVQMGKIRRRDNAFNWGLYEHTEDPDCFVESFNVESWLEHLRQHERITESDRLIQDEVMSLLKAGTSPSVNHYVAPARQRTD